jgi:hypothetical protein
VAAAAVVAVTLAAWASTPTTGFVSGSLQAVGGPAPGKARPISGRVTVRGAKGETYSVKVRADGQFLIQVPVDSGYFVVGSSPFYDGGVGVYLAGPLVAVHENATTSDVIVSCRER